jgi:transposase
MPAARARRLVLAACDRHRLKRLERSQTAPWRQVLRAKIVLLAARPMPNAQIAARLGITVDTARKWRGRFATDGMDGLADRPRAGRPPHFTPVQVAEVKALACQLPAEQGVPLSRWSCPELAREAIIQGIAAAISASTIARWLAEDAIKPWQHRSWIFIRDPDFRTKAARILDLYARRWQGEPLRPDEYVLCADEKTSIQARCRCHPTLPPGKARMMRVNHDYDRKGALAYLAAYDVAQAKVYGNCAPSTGIKPFMALVEQIMTREPYASATRVFWIVDNGSSHRGQAAVDRLAKRFRKRGHHPHPTACLLAQPGRDLLLRRAAQGRGAQRLHPPRPGQAATGRLRAALQRHRSAFSVEVHPSRPRRPARQD